MLAVVLVLVFVGITAVMFYRQCRRRKTEAFLKMVHDAGIEGRWVEIITQAHQTMPAEEVQRLERAMYMLARVSKESPNIRAASVAKRTRLDRDARNRPLRHKA